MNTRNRLSTWKRFSVIIASTTTILFNGLLNPSLAGDPFRANNGRQIGDKTEAAFRAIFEKGNYPEGKLYLQQAEASEPNEPLVYALQASLAYMDQDWGSFKSYADQTLQKAQQLTSRDNLRGNIYTAVAYFLQAGYSLEKQGQLQALARLKDAFQYLDEAKKIAPEDQELNLLKGYIELILAVNLPFSDPSQAIEQLQKYAAPQYLANRGLAIGYRDMKQYSKAEESVNNALSRNPEHPEINYLKAQVLVKMGKRQDAQKYFQSALSKSNQLPKSLVAQIFHEYCRNQRSIDNKELDCEVRRAEIEKQPGSWGNSKLTSLN